jgi:hypothetical protein
MAHGEVRTWITAHYEVDEHGKVVQFDVKAHAAMGFGERDAVVHVDLPAAEHDAVQDVLEEVRINVDQDLIERAEEAALTHRIQHRDQGIDWRKPAEYSGPEVTEEDQVYSDPAIMELKAGDRADALMASIPAHLREGR